MERNTKRNRRFRIQDWWLTCDEPGTTRRHLKFWVHEHFHKKVCHSWSYNTKHKSIPIKNDNFSCDPQHFEGSKRRKKIFAPWHAYHWIIEPHYIHALQGHSGCWAGAAAAVHTHTRSYNKTATDFSYIYLSLAHSFSSASASLVEMMLREGGQEELSRGRDLTRLKMATIATMFAKDKLMKQLPLNVV